MIAGAALLVLAAWSPFALLRLIPMMEIAAASVTSQRSSMSAAAGSAGIQSPAALHATGDGQELAAVHFTGQRDHGRNDVLAVAFDRAERRADGQRPARRIGDARDARRRFASRALVELVRWHRLPDGPAARRDNLSWLPARFRDPDRFAARVGHAFASSDATAPTPRAAASA